MVSLEQSMTGPNGGLHIHYLPSINLCAKMLKCPSNVMLEMWEKLLLDSEVVSIVTLIKSWLAPRQVWEPRQPFYFIFFNFFYSTHQL